MYVNFEKLNHLFGGNTRYDDVDTTPYESAQKEFLEYLKKADEEYRRQEKEAYEFVEDVMPAEPGYKYLQYDGPSAEQITADTTRAYSQALEQESNALLAEYEQDRRAGEQKKSALTRQAAGEAAQAEEKNREEKRGTLSDVAANGMGRSSVYELAGRAFDEQLEREKSGIAGQLEADVAEIDGMLAQLQKDHERAESELNAEYALELAAEIDKLQQERRQEEERIKKYNNDTARRTLDYKDDRRKAIVKQLEEIYEAEYERAQQEAVAKDYTGAKRESYQDRLQAAIDFYSQYPTAVAGRLIGDNETALERYLGYYLPRLKKELGIDDMGVSDDL